MSGPPPGYYPPPPGYPGAMPPGYPGTPGFAPPGFPRPPFPGPPPQGLRPLPAIPLGGAAASANTSVYVGKISPLVDDDIMRAVLETCGPLRSWKRSTDPSTGVVKRFGFAEYETADGVLRCVRVLRDYSLAGAQLQVNLSQAAQKYLDWHVEQLKTKRGVIAAPAQPAQAGDAGGQANLQSVADETGEAETRAKIEAILLEHLGNEETIKSRYSLVSEPEPQRPLPPPPLPPPPPLGMNGSAFVSGGNLPLSAVDTRTPPAPSEARQGPEDPAERQRQLERERERRERERKEEARHEDRRLLDLERALDRAEAERERERQREAERLREARKSRQRELERDLQDGGASSEDAMRRAFQKRRRDTRARDERRRKRQRELEEDDAERRREMADAAAQQLVVEEAADRAARAADVPVPTTTAVPQALEPVEQPMAPNGAPPPEDSAAGAQIGGVFVPGTSLGTLGFLKKAPVKRTTVNAPLFSETEEAPARRTLVPLEYTEEELRAALVNEYAQPEEPPESAGAAAAAAEPADEARRSERTERRRREKEERDAKRALLAMIDAIPTTKDALFAHPVDWSTFDKHNVSATVASWATKKVAELLGEAPPALVDFITQQTAQHVAPQAILDELQMVLDEEAEAFVIKLWRLVIFETLKASTTVPAA